MGGFGRTSNSAEVKVHSTAEATSGFQLLSGLLRKHWKSYLDETGFVLLVLWF